MAHKRGLRWSLRWFCAECMAWLRGAGIGRQTSARGKGWQRSGGARELENAKKNDHAIASLAARPAGWGLRLGPKGEWVWIVVYVCKW